MSFFIEYKKRGDENWVRDQLTGKDTGRLFVSDRYSDWFSVEITDVVVFTALKKGLAWFHTHNDGTLHCMTGTTAVALNSIIQAGEKSNVMMEFRVVDGNEIKSSGKRSRTEEVEKETKIQELTNLLNEAHMEASCYYFLKNVFERHIFALWNIMDNSKGSKPSQEYMQGEIYKLSMAFRKSFEQTYANVRKQNKRVINQERIDAQRGDEQAKKLLKSMEATFSEQMKAELENPNLFSAILSNNAIELIEQDELLKRIDNAYYKYDDIACRDAGIKKLTADIRAQAELNEKVLLHKKDVLTFLDDVEKGDELLTKKRTETNAEIQALSDAKTLAQQEFDQAKKESDDLKTALDNLKKDFDNRKMTLEEELDAIKQRCILSNQNFAETKADMDTRFEKMRVDMHARLQESEHELDAAHITKMRSLQAEYDSRFNELKNKLLGEETTLKAELMQKLMDEEITHKRELQTRISTSEITLSTLDDQIKNRSEELAKLGKEKESKESELELFNAGSEKITQQYQSMKIDIQKLKTEETQLKESIQKLKTEQTQLQESIQGMQRLMEVQENFQRSAAEKITKGNLNALFSSQADKVQDFGNASLEAFGESSEAFGGDHVQTFEHNQDFHQDQSQAIGGQDQFQAIGGQDQSQAIGGQSPSVIRTAARPSSQPPARDPLRSLSGSRAGSMSSIFDLV